jgi:hypothetical protein
MRPAVVALFVILVVPGVATAQDATPVLVDRHMTVGAGATVSTAVGAALARAEARVLPDKLFDERGLGRRSANIGYRFYKLALFDLPQEQFIQVATHEIFGHGGRLRERFTGAISYGIDLPPPYGPGGGVTSFALDRQPTRYEAQAVSGGGMEADSVAAGVLFRRAVVDRRTTPRDAMRYLYFELDTLRYIGETGDGPQEPGQDVGDWLAGYNEIAGPLGGAPLRARTLRREVLVSLATPMLAYAVFGIGRYVWNGDANVPVPGIRIGRVRYLPMARYRLAPYGTEIETVHEIADAGGLTEVRARFGRAPASTPWGIGVRRQDVAGWRRWRIDAGVDVWRQPALIGDPVEIDPSQSRVGVEARGVAARPVLPVWFGSRRATLIIDVSAKSRGYVAGEPLGGGLVARAGIGWPFCSIVRRIGRAAATTCRQARGSTRRPRRAARATPRLPPSPAGDPQRRSRHAQTTSGARSDSPAQTHSLYRHVVGTIRRAGFQIWPHVSQRQYAALSLLLLVVITCVDRQNGQTACRDVSS